jgi:hypothetical protein
MTFEDLKFEPFELGICAHHLYPNHYGVSVVRGPYTYGGDKGLYELAVLKMTPDMKESELCYDTPITGDVMGHLSPEEITEIMKQVSELPNAE